MSRGKKDCEFDFSKGRLNAQKVLHMINNSFYEDRKYVAKYRKDYLDTAKSILRSNQERHVDAWMIAKGWASASKKNAEIDKDATA